MIVTLLLTSAQNSFLARARQQPEVLLLSSRDPDLPDVAALIEETETQILEGHSRPLHFSLEYLDPAVYSANTSDRTQVMAFFRARHQRRDFDLVITLDEQALRCVEKPRADLFADTPLVYSITNRNDALTKFKRPPASTGVIGIVNYLPAVQLALRETPALAMSLF